MYDKEIMKVTTCGRVFRLKSAFSSNIGEITYTKSKGYVVVCVAGKSLKVHRMVMQTYDPIENWKDMQVNHIDGNKENNSILNLEWCSCKENIRHAWRTGLSFSSEEKTEARRKGQIKKWRTDELFDKSSRVLKKILLERLKTRLFDLEDYLFVRMETKNKRGFGYAISKCNVTKDMNTEEFDPELRDAEWRRCNLARYLIKENASTYSTMSKKIIRGGYKKSDFEYIKTERLMKGGKNPEPYWIGYLKSL